MSSSIALLIAKAEKPHTIGETLLEPCILSAAKTLLIEEIDKKFQKISLSDSTVRRRIDEPAEDIKLQVLEKKIKLSPFFSIRCNESTDEGNCVQLLVYARCVANDSAEDEMLFSQALKTTTTADDILETVSIFLETNELNWKKLVGVCTDGAPAMLGSRQGFLAKNEGKIPLLSSCTASFTVKNWLLKLCPAIYEKS
jgi:hypothetical protein